jgi:hypothetical protein
MLDLFEMTLWASVTGYGLWRVSAVVERVGLAFVERLGDFKPIRESLLPPPPPAIPDDLAALAFSETEPWAKEETLRAIREKYEEYHDWSKVRIAFGVAPRPE